MNFWLIWSILQFFQLLPAIGHFAVTLQRLLANLLSCIIAFVFFTLMMGQIFFRLVNENRVQCDKQFDWEGARYLYSSFLVLIHMIDFRTIEVEDRVTVYITHVIFVFMASIMLINFLIALFSSTVTWVSNHKHLILDVQLLSMLSVMEYRLSHIDFINKYYRRHLSQYFVKKNGKLYILMTEADIQGVTR